MPAPSDSTLPPNQALGLFHPVFQAWFREKVGVPTDVQARSWPVIAGGGNVLLTAPTGSGKTLTAFLWALDAFATGRAEPGTTRILYVSPLKALNNDIQRNLLGPLEELRARFSAASLGFPDIRVLVRSGDTPGGERRRMLRHPPEILITTPESLNLLLLTAAGRDSLRGVGTVILDEIHAVAGTKRGTHLITAVDRLVPLAGEFQRIALSATVKPLKAVADWVGGFIREGLEYRPRPMEIVESRAPKAYELHIRYPVDGRPAPHLPDDPMWLGGVYRPLAGASTAASKASEGRASEAPEDEVGIWESMAREIKTLVGQARSTLIFANNRRLSERLARLLNEDEPKAIAYAHHGSLSREIRSVVEARMKEGRLPAIVATSSLELGIDIGALDQVVLVETPTSVAAALQRLGRAGHGVGQVSRGSLFASHPRDILDATVAVKCMEAGDIEDVRTVENPLDLLAQILVSMTVSEEWDLDALYGFIRASHPYRTLPRRSFDLVVEMLAGRYADTRIRELRPRIAVDAVERKVRALKGATLLVGLSGGTIPDRGYYTLRHAESRAKIGELDEEFVWERRVGELFSLGSRSWRIVNIGANEVDVAPADRHALMTPFWRAEERDRDAHFSGRLAEFLEEAEARIQDPAFAEGLSRDRRLEPGAAAALLAFLRRQREATGAPLPHRHHLLVEDAGEAPVGGTPGGGAAGGRQVVLHAVWGGRLTRPWGYALAAAWEEKNGAPLEIIQDDDGLLIRLPQGEPALGLLDLVNADNLENLLRRSLERTGFFAGHFRENAARALLLPRSMPGSRVPLWFNRLRSQKLLGAISGFGDFPIVLETWRECLRDEFALDALRARLEEVQSGVIRVREARTAKPSPFAEGLIWKQTNQFMYERDKPGPWPPGPARGGQGPGTGGGARTDLLREIAFSAPLRPRIPRGIIRDFEAKAQRLAPGYPPQGSRELVEWVKERLLIPRPEWEALLPLAGLEAETRDPAQGNPAGYLASRLVGVSLPGAETPLLAAVESLPGLLRSLGIGRGDLALSGAEEPGSAPAPEALASLDRLLADGGAAREGGGEARGDPQAARTAGAADAAAAGMAAEAAWETTGETDIDAAGETSAEASVGAPADRATAFLSQWLRAYGPVTPELLRGIFGDAFPLIEDALGHLSESGKVITDLLAEDAAGAEICDAANVETLLRLMRRRSRPAVRALPAQQLPLFSAAWQGLAAPARGIEGVQGALERLFGFPATAAAWEADILPARVMPYQTPWLDALFRDNGVLWFGAGKERAAFAFPEDVELFLEAGGAAPVLPESQRQVLEILGRAAPARLDFQALAARLPFSSEALAGALWDLAWSGRITNDTFAALRRGIETSFRVAMPDPAANAGRRGGFQRWKAARPLAGSWLALEAGAVSDPLEREDLAKDRARQLLRRYGVVFRELLHHELPALQWSRVFRALRLMELSGEVLSGHFFDGVPGLQFLSPSALPLVEDALPEDAVYWMAAADPASPCGLGLTGLPYALPPRASGTHMVFHGSELVLVSRRLGRDLALRVPPRHTYLASYLGSLRHLVERAFLPARSLDVETVNGIGAMGSPYADDLMEAGFERGLKAFSMRRSFA